MKKQYVVMDLSKKETKNGKPYYMFSAWSGGKKIGAKIWDIEQELDNGTLITGDPKEESYKGKISFVFKGYSIDSPNEAVKNEHLGRDSVDANVTYDKIISSLSDIEDDFYRHLGLVAYSTYECQLLEAYGAKSVHHNYKGGLLGHIGEVVELCEKIASTYPKLNSDLLICGAALHDLGKVKTYEGEEDAIEYSFDGMMADHLVMGAEMIGELEDFTPNQLGVEERFKMKLVKHMILSHHGLREWGSPIQPRIPEAQALHFMDNLSSKMSIFKAEKNSFDGKGEFTDRVYTLDTFIYTGEY